MMIFALVFFVKSISFEAYEGGSANLEANPDYVVTLIASFFFFAYTLQLLIGDLKDGSCRKAESRLINFGVITTLFSLYPLGRFFRGLIKGYSYDDIQVYLYFGLVNLVFLLVIILDAYKYLKCKKCKEEA